MSVVKYLKVIKTCFGLFLGGDILLFAFGYKVLGAIALFGGLILMWRLYRCPNCGHELDDRMSLKDIECCPYCGCDFNKKRKEF